jgi:hypothetical protein
MNSIIDSNTKNLLYTIGENFTTYNLSCSLEPLTPTKL